jgi:hypothetical protein
MISAPKSAMIALSAFIVFISQPFMLIERNSAARSYSRGWAYLRCTDYLIPHLIRLPIYTQVQVLQRALEKLLYRDKSKPGTSLRKFS